MNFSLPMSFSANNFPFISLSLPQSIYPHTRLSSWWKSRSNMTGNIVEWLELFIVVEMQLNHCSMMNELPLLLSPTTHKPPPPPHCFLLLSSERFTLHLMTFFTSFHNFSLSAVWRSCIVCLWGENKRALEMKENWQKVT